MRLRTEGTQTPRQTRIYAQSISEEDRQGYEIYGLIEGKNYKNYERKISIKEKDNTS